MDFGTIAFMTNQDLYHLIQRGWVEIEHFFSDDLVTSLLSYAQKQKNIKTYQNAQVGRQSSQVINTSIRSDSIYWVEDWNANNELKSLGDLLKKNGKYLAENLRLSLKSFEGHFSHYREGDFYRKHLDQHHNTKHRQVTFVSYLTEGEGGELVIYSQADRNQVEKVVAPKKGKAVIFLSSLIFHEVLPSKFDRFSFTGWYRDDMDLYNDILSLI